MNNLKKALLRALLGVPIGIAIGATCTLIINIVIYNMYGKVGGTGYNSLNFYIVSYIVSAAIGAVFGATSIIWELEKLSLRAQTTLHFFITITVHLGCAIIAKWIPVKLSSILMYVGIYVTIYVITFLITYSVQKKKVNEVNKALEG